MNAAIYLLSRKLLNSSPLKKAEFFLLFVFALLMTGCATTGSNGGGWYTIQRGDTFGAIAREHHIPLLRLQRLNPRINQNALRVGERIRLPETSERAPGSGLYSYRIRQGDTISGLANEFSSSTTAIQNANPGLNTSQLGVGTLIRIPTNGASRQRQIMAQRAAPATPIPNGVGNWQWPLAGATVAREFGYNERNILEPMLLTAKNTYTARAAVAAKVSFADDMRQLGGVVILHSAHNMQAVYAECSTIYVKAGDSVSPGSAICSISPNPNSGKAQLVFDVRHAGKPVDPRRVLRK